MDLCNSFITSKVKDVKGIFKQNIQKAQEVFLSVSNQSLKV